MFDRFKPSLILTTTFVVAAAALVPVSDAQACGGFFCSQAAPVNQSAEQIIFSKNDDGTVTAVVSIQYSGTAERFAWILPIAGVPDVTVSSNLAFQRLLTATTPRYSLTQRVEGTCKQQGFGDPNSGFASGGTTASGGAAGASNAVPGGGPVVTVVAEGSAGPYDFVAISVSQDANDPARVALDWLADNDYDVSAFGEEILGEYLADGLNLLAFRLTKGNTTGSIRPVRVTYPAEYPAIPIRPTAVAANDDMGVMVYMVAEAQAIPKNYKSLLLNEALINWFNFAPTYNAVISRAAAEAEGQGFVSEFAGPSVSFNETVFSQFDQQNWEQFQDLDFSAGQPLQADGGVPTNAVGMAMFNAAAAQYGAWDGFREAVQEAVTLPTSVPFDAWISTPWLYEGDPEIQIDSLKLLAGLQRNVIDPMVETQRLLISQPYLTRMFTTMSPEDMTVDPLFSINPDLADISNVHTAERVIECSPDWYVWEAPWRVELPQGGTVRGNSTQQWPFDPVVSDMPANRKIVELSEEGSGDVVTDNSQAIWQALNVAQVVPNPALGRGGSGNVPIGGVDEMIGQGSTVPPLSADADDDSGCAIRHTARGSTGALALGLLASLITLARRRRLR
jgi:hypothetical protein